MNKRVVIGIIIGALVGILLLIVGYLIYVRNSDPGKPTVTDVFKSFFPYGETDPIVGTPGEVIIGTPNATSSAPLPRLRLISRDPVAGFTLYDRNMATTSTSTIVETVVRFIDKGTGHVFETNENSSVVERISNNTLPKLHEATFATKDSFVARRFDTAEDVIETFVGTLVPISATSTKEFSVKGSFMPGNIASVAVSSNRLFTLYSSVGGSSGFISSPIGATESRVFSSPLGSWLVDWTSANSIVFTSKPSADYTGNAFIFNPSTTAFTKIIGPIKGLLVSLSPNGSHLLYSESTGSTFRMFYQNRNNNLILELSSKTLPEKCVWSERENTLVFCASPENIPNGSYPDDWYKGLVSFTDKIISFDLESNRETSFVSLQTESGLAIDATRLDLNPRETQLYFINKSDYSLWSFDLP